MFLQGAKPVYVLSGTVKDSLGEPVSYATVRVAHNAYYIATDTEGSFEMKLPAGKYEGTVEATGYKPESFQINLNEDKFLDIILEEDAIQLKGVNVYGKSTAKKLEEGAFSVNAVEITPNLNKMVTLNDIVDRTAGVKARREGDVGSDFD